MPFDTIIVKGAREHNLKNIDLVIPRDCLVVVTGVSGSGKSSLAFDTIYAEGQRRYVESLSAYARQFLGRMEKPDVDYIEGLSPAISIDQKGTSRNPRSTVGTVTEIYDYLRLLFARVGTPHCPLCGREITAQTVEQIVAAVQNLPEGSRALVLAPLVRDRKGEYQSVFENLRKSGYARVRVDGEVADLSQEFALEKNVKHTIEAVIDRIIIGQTERSRLADSVETALKLAEGTMIVSIVDGEEMLFSEHLACVHDGFSLGELAPRSFSFNSPHGACPSCTGLGVKMEIDPELVMPDRELSIDGGGIRPAWWYSWRVDELARLARRHEFSTATPLKELEPEHLNLILYGEGGATRKYRNRFGKVRVQPNGYEGVIPYLKRLADDTQSSWTRHEIERYTLVQPCPDCGGQRLKPEVLAVTIDGRNIAETASFSVKAALDWVKKIGGKHTPLTSRQQIIAREILKELNSRLGFLRDVGLDYLGVDRASATLSGGESQRIRLATQIGSGLMGVLYICDEPTVGLHPADTSRLIQTMLKLRDIGNTIIVVEHDEAMMRAADHIIDMGPGAGENGGKVVATGKLAEICNNDASITGKYLSGKLTIPVPATRREGSGEEIIIKGARANNLKNIYVSIPLGKLICVSGISGSGKSTLITDTLYRRLAHILYGARRRSGEVDVITGIEHIDKVIDIDQSPIGRTPRSNPATYTGVFTGIRDLFATAPEAKLRGYAAGRFSFNVKGGRCEACRGEGYTHIEMQFLPDVTVPCEVCHGQRYNQEALEIRFKGKNIAEVLDMTVSQASEFFANFPKAVNKLKTLRDVGLGYIRLGQPATTLSGGEAQRVKLATELSRRGTGRTLYILDEPTTGLSFPDVAALLGVLQRLVDAGNTVVIIEHNLDVLRNADYIIDLGPGAGDAGGYVITTGTPEEIMQVSASQTGSYMAKGLNRRIPDGK
jgi:excinuclease ABC subunit A